jgi:hypothetical protein
LIKNVEELDIGFMYPVSYETFRVDSQTMILNNISSRLFSVEMTEACLFISTYCTQLKTLKVNITRNECKIELTGRGTMIELQSLTISGVTLSEQMVGVIMSSPISFPKLKHLSFLLPKSVCPVTIFTLIFKSAFHDQLESIKLGIVNDWEVTNNVKQRVLII